MRRNLDEIEIYDYKIPRTCEKCDGVMVYKGVGEYACEECGEMEG